MARTDTLTNFLTDVAAAIKTVRGDETDIPAPEFDTEILNLTSGGGGDSTLKGLIERNLTSITIPDGVTSIGYYAFYGCTKLTSITIPDSITIIRGYAFCECGRLTSMIIPSGVKSIEIKAFSYCKNLAEIDFSSHTSVPALESTSVFSETSANLVIKVPSALLDEWKAATNWATYADKIVGV